MTILEVAQGHYARIPEGSDKDLVIARLDAEDQEFLAKFPECRKYHRPSWRILTVSAAQKAPMGYQWYVIVDGRLTRHSAQYDSSD